MSTPNEITPLWQMREATFVSHAPHKVSPFRRVMTRTSSAPQLDTLIRYFADSIGSQFIVSTPSIFRGVIFRRKYSARTVLITSTLQKPLIYAPLEFTLQITNNADYPQQPGVLFMKFTAIFIAATIALHAHADTVICGKLKPTDKRLYPINKLAIEIAVKTGLKTCNASERYKEAVLAAKHKPTFKVVTKEQLKAAKQELSKAMGAGGQASGIF